jgi:hypothetical protein
LVKKKPGWATSLAFILKDMRPFLLFIVFVLTSFHTKAPVVSAWTVERNSMLAIDGSSNINQFTCDVREYLRQDTLRAVPEQGRSRYLFTSGSKLSLDIRRFDCHHVYITSDFRKMLKAEAYPCIDIHFINLDEFRNGTDVKGQVMVQLAGKRKVMDITYRCTQSGPDQIRLQGGQVMKFSDFELTAPRKIGGLIRINPEIRVNFDLYFKKLHS